MNELVETTARRLDPEAWRPIDGKAPETAEMFGRREASCDRARKSLKDPGSLLECVALAIEEAGDRFCELSGEVLPGTFERMAAQAALKAHEEWLESQGLVVVPKGLPNTDATGQYIIPPSAAHQQEE